jgi:hypothetical protein
LLARGLGYSGCFVRKNKVIIRFGVEKENLIGTPAKQRLDRVENETVENRKLLK